MVSMPLVVVTASSMRLVISDSTSSAELDGETQMVGDRFRKQIDAQREERKCPHHQRHDQHGEDWRLTQRG
jgi:hypothetical protein